jgi:hypothetical protein
MSEKKIQILSKPTENQVLSIINRIAELYHQPEAIVYEYIQNSIDSATILEKEKGLKTPFQILVHMDTTKSRYIIQDNCEGMSEEKIIGLPEDIFASDKKKYPWVVGQFGYGIQSFRAWFNSIKILSKNMDEEKTTSIKFRQKDPFGIQNNEVLVPFGQIYPCKFDLCLSERKHGTDVYVEKMINKGARNSSFNYVSEKLISNIPIHFEDVLNDGTVEIKIFRWVKRKGICRPQVIDIMPIDYSTIKGEDISGEIKSENGEVLAEYNFKIIETGELKNTPEIKDYLPRLSRLGTTLSPIMKLTSFLDYCENHDVDITPWERAELMGKVNIKKKIDLDLNRNDLTPSIELEYIYKKLEELTNEISNKFKEIDKKKIQEHEESLSEIMSDVFSDVSKGLDVEIKARLRAIRTNQAGFQGESDTGAGIVIGGDEHTGDGKGGNKSGKEIDNEVDKGNIQSDTSDSEGNPPNKEEGEIGSKMIKQSGLDIDFKSLGETMPASQLWGDTIIVINKDHPFYKERLGQNNKKIISKRLIAYLAFATTPWFLDLYYRKHGFEIESKEKNEKIVETIAIVERTLWDKRDEIRKKVAEVEDD